MNIHQSVVILQGKSIGKSPCFQKTSHDAGIEVIDAVEPVVAEKIDEKAVYFVWVVIKESELVRLGMFLVAKVENRTLKTSEWAGKVATSLNVELW